MAKLVVNPVVNLYGLRAGLSYISVENDKVRAIEAEAARRREAINARRIEMNDRISKENNRLNALKRDATNCGDVRLGIYLGVMLVAFIGFLVAFIKMRVKYIETFNGFVYFGGAALGLALVCITLFIGFLKDLDDSLLAIWDDVSTFFFAMVPIVGVIGGIATLAVFLSQGIKNHAVGYCGLLFAGVVYGGLFCVINILRIILNVVKKMSYKSQARAAEKKLKQLEKEASALAPVLKNEAEQTAAWRAQNLKPHLRNIFNMYAALRQAFSFFLDERDWAHIDLLIFELETRRADSLKEALQLVDRELQTQRLENLICNATRAIVGTLRSGFSMLQQSLTAVYNGLSEQLSGISGQLSGISSQIASSQAMNAALLSKANVTSEKMVNELKGIRTNSDYARLRLG